MPGPRVGWSDVGQFPFLLILSPCTVLMSHDLSPGKISPDPLHCFGTRTASPSQAAWALGVLSSILTQPAA